MPSLVSLIRNNKINVKYDTEFNKNWNDNELYSHIIELYCFNNQLQKLPDNLHNCQTLYCYNNQLQQLPDNLHNC